MKTCFVLLLLTPVAALGSYQIRPIASQPVQHTWFCTADGYDYSGSLRSISGGLKSSKDEAASDALRACRGFYTNCEVSSCFQEQ